MSEHWNYVALVDYLANRLESDAQAQDEGRIWQIGQGYELFDTALPRGGGRRYDKLFVGLRFWDSWIDARNHAWQYYPGLDREDWSGLARRIVAHLRADRDVTDPDLVDWFGPDPRGVFGKRLRERIARLARQV